MMMAELKGLKGAAPLAVVGSLQIHRRYRTR